MTEPAPHLTELLDLTDVVDHVTRVHVSDMLRAGNMAIPPPTEDAISEALQAMRVADRNLLRSAVLRLVYPGAREIAEQAYARAWDRARQLVDERTGEADQTLGTLDTDPDPDHAPVDYELELNPFAEGVVIV